MHADLNEIAQQEAKAKIKSPVKTLTSWHMLAIFVTLFGIVFTVNGYFIYMSIKTNPGEIGHAYLEGLKFNETLDSRAKQKEAGWDMTLSMKRGAGGDALFTAKMVDRAGAPVGNLEMTGRIFRNTDNKDDHALQFIEVGKGEYNAHVPNLGPGKWVFSAKAVKPNAPDFTTETSISIR